MKEVPFHRNILAYVERFASNSEFEMQPKRFVNEFNISVLLSIITCESLGYIMQL